MRSTANMAPSVEDLPTVLCIAGPTGSGKTALAIALAHALNGEIINADSRQVYADFPIVTAQPDPDERAAVPHYLYGFFPADAELCAASWAEMAASQCRQLIYREKLPILVGGTGFYFEALLRGLAKMPPIPPSIRHDLAHQLAEKGSENLHRNLSAIDRGYAASIHPHDRQRILRALEVFMASGKPFSHWLEKTRKPLAKGATLILDIPLPLLHPRLETRIHHMLSQGAISEVTQAAHKYPTLPKPGFSSIGCAEILAFVNGAITRENCIAQWLKATRAYAKRQLTWFRGRGRGIMLEKPDPALALAKLCAEAPECSLPRCK